MPHRRGLLRIFGIIPGIGWIIVLLANIWVLVAMVVAVRRALDYKSTNRAIGVCMIGFIVEIIIMGPVYNVLGSGAAPITVHPAPV